jgi:hypothetical protein
LAQPLERPVDVIERCFNGDNTLVRTVGHA